MMCVYCKFPATTSIVRANPASGWAVNVHLCDACFEGRWSPHGGDDLLIEEVGPTGVRSLFTKLERERDPSAQPEKERP